jgi:hypothetical protein
MLLSPYNPPILIFGLFKRLSINAVDLHRRKELAMTLFATIAFAAFILKYKDLFAFALFDDVAFDGGALQYRLADTNRLAVAQHQNLIKRDLGADIAGQLFNAQDFAGLYSILFASCGNDCIHV